MPYNRTADIEATCVANHSCGLVVGAAVTRTSLTRDTAVGVQEEQEDHRIGQSTLISRFQR